MRAVGSEAEHICPDIGREVRVTWSSTASWSLDSEPTWPRGGKGRDRSISRADRLAHSWEKRYREGCVAVSGSVVHAFIL